MPIIREVALALSVEQVLRRQGIREHSMPRLEITALLYELLASVNDLHLLEPAITYELHLITEVRHDQVCLENGTVLYGRLLPSLLSSAMELAAAVCTIGPRLEEKVANYFSNEEPLRGLLLDGIGSAAVDSLVQKACQLVRHEALSRSYQASSPLNPGMPGWSISEQWHLFQLVPAEQIGVRLTPLAIMSPRKSTSMVIGIGTEMPTWTQAEACDRCSLKQTCAYKVIPRQGDEVEPKSTRT